MRDRRLKPFDPLWTYDYNYKYKQFLPNFETIPTKLRNLLQLYKRNPFRNGSDQKRNRLPFNIGNPN